MKREMTQEDKELAAAGYEHLERKRSKGANDKDEEHEKVDITEHHLPFAELAAALQTSIDTKDPGASDGLTEAEAKARLARDGPNVLTPPKKKSALRKYWDCLVTMFNILLIIAGILEYILLGIDFKDNFQNTYLGGILIAVAFINAFIEFYQLQKSEAILASFLAMIPPSCRVVRDGTIASIPASDLVKGDVVLVRSGDKTPADLLMFAATDLKIDNSSLTGESEPQERRGMPDGSPSRPAEAENLLFNSTLVVNGEGWGVVVRTGDHTFIGQIAKLTGGESGNKSPLGVEIGQFVVAVSCIAIVFAIVFFAVGITTAYKGDAALTVTFAVSILVAFVPEGLPSVVTLLLSIAAKRMASQNVLVKDLQGVETLGSLTLLATDKTGTLTRNQMTVTNLWSGGRMFTAFQSPGMKELVDIAALNSRIKFDKTDVPFDQRQILGDATETGLTRFAGRHIADYDAHQKQYPKFFEVPFNSTNKWALVILKKPHSTGDLTLYIKGAPERVLAKCSAYLKDGDIYPMTDEFRKSYDDAYNYMASRGHRVIACAQSLLSGEHYSLDYAFSKNDGNYPSTDYCFVGLVSLEDPPKHGVREAIGTLRLAGIKVMMVTGDHPLTAEAIARKINLILGDTKESLAKKTNRPVEEIYEDEVTAVVVHGDDIDGLQGWQWDQIFSKQEIVFARTSPQHKLEIVKRAQALGHIVGVTGDGVNDSPALKKADLGIAMNISGSDVSKEAANMILLDDNFASTVKGVAEGRQIFVNLKRSIQYTISHSTPEVIPQLLYVVVPIPLPLSAILILVIDLGFELFVALSFAWDQPETVDGLMRLGPRKPVNERSINALKSRALRRTKTLRRDPETNDIIPPSRGSVVLGKLRAPFTREFWEDKFEKTENETLVDKKLLSYAYLEAGMIETVGCLVAYFVVFFASGFSPSDLVRAQKASVNHGVFGSARQMWCWCLPSTGTGTAFFTKHSPDFINYQGKSINAHQQINALAKAQSIVYLSVFIQQCFNVFAVKANFRFPFGRRVIGNKWNFAGIFAGACLGMFIIYTPPLHVVFGGTDKLSPLYWLIPVGFGCVMLAWACIRVLLMKKAIEDKRVKDIKGLMMLTFARNVPNTYYASSTAPRGYVPCMYYRVMYRAVSVICPL
ncbi:aminophospholipid-transporting P-type ATPase [Punctularia strigosozonata HHB-11173 SS5]|uniref:aminophospholipid-transporting P-type ATPase n=1 Tax=Punctularia strigosozonata (strain HHB-11173) TaxID=741275 RepID=UPI0004417711|nr:aminophospholipid-transporting P-type ATPase [Punctularia strigosozonata HHB-11173 SS5]EIN07923.1 aminophospholipid-transporting P-type ATPase [Punctularia strigosozonata HHB-11173 SS5]